MIKTPSFVFICSLILMLSCSNSDKSDKHEHFEPPLKVKIAPHGTYTVNVLNGKPVKWLINYNNDTIRTGKMTPILFELKYDADSAIKDVSKKIDQERITIKSDFFVDTILTFHIPIDSFQVAFFTDTIASHKSDISEFPEFSKISNLKFNTDTGILILPKIISRLPPDELVLPDGMVKSINLNHNVHSTKCKPIQDNTGNYWFGGSNLTYYDGDRFYEYDLNSNGLNSNVLQLESDSRNNLWMLHPEGLTRFDGSNFIRYDKSNGLPPFEYSSMSIDHDDNIIVISNEGILKISKNIEGEFYRVNIENSYNLNVLHDSNNNIIGSHYSGLLFKIYDHDPSKIYFLNLYKIIQYKNNRTLFIDRSDAVWIGSLSFTEVLKYTDDTLYVLKVQDKNTTRPTKLAGVMSFAQDQNGRMYLGTHGTGAYTIDETGEVRWLQQNRAISDQFIHTLFVDNHNQIWYGGVYRGFDILGSEPPRLIDKVYEKGDLNHCFHIDKFGDSLIFATRYSGIMVLIGSEAFRITHTYQKKEQENKLINKFNWWERNQSYFNLSHSLLKDQYGRLWIGFREGNEVMIIDTTDYVYHLKCVGSQRLANDDQGNVWLSDSDLGTSDSTTTSRQINYFDSSLNYFQSIPTDKYFFDASHPVIQSKEGGIIAGGNSLSIIDKNKNIIQYGQSNGMFFDYIHSVQQDDEGMIWMASYDDGIACFNGKEFTYFNKRIGLLNNTVESIALDTSGNLVSCHRGGISVINFNKDGNLKIRVYTHEDGIIGIWANEFGAYTDENNVLYYGSASGINEIHLNDLYLTKHTPSVKVNAIDINSKLTDFLGDPNLNKYIEYDSSSVFYHIPYNPKFTHLVDRLTIHYGSNNPVKNQGVEYIYKLNDEEPWSDPTRENSIDIRNPVPGFYSLKVRARYKYGNWGDILVFPFKIAPPWWLSNAAKAGYAALLLSTFFLLSNWRTRRLKHMQRVLEKKVEIATVEIKEQKDRAERSEAFKQQFLANMSHEIRTPMNAVMGMTSLLLDTDLNKKQRDYLEKVKISSDNLLHIINDILDLSKIEAGKMELEHIDMSLSDCLDLVKNTLQYKADEKGLQLFVRVDQDVDDVVIGDPVRLNQVLINLCGNAIKFTERGSVSIEVKKSDGKVRFAVIDTGIGISKDKLEAVFESFNQANTSDTRKFGGTGLGLSISQELVGLMGGSIKVESKEGSGTTFYFDLELEKGDPQRLEQRLASEENVDGSILDGLTILVADDNEYNRIVARDTLLSNAKVNIIEAENGQEVLDKLTPDIDIILMDAQMPVMSGFESTKRIRAMADEKFSRIPVIALTASVLRTDLDRCTEAGMNGYLPKPFKTHDLIIEIAKTLNIELKYSGMKNSIKASPVERSNGTITDLTYLRNFCEGDEKKMKKYIDLFLSSAPHFIDQINQLMADRKTDKLASQLHSFYTRLVMMGMSDQRSEALVIESKLKDGLLDEGLRERLERLINQISQATEELKNSL